MEAARTAPPGARSIAGARVEAWELAALGAACLTLAGSLYLSLGMGLNACPLCFYQRTFIMAVVGVLAVGRALALPVRAGTLSLLALPLALAGLGVALVHNNLVWTGVLVCPAGILGLGSAPLQSLLAFLIVTVLLLPGALAPVVSQISGAARVVGAGLLAAVFTAFSVLSSPKLAPFNPKYGEAGKRVIKGCERAGPEASVRPRGV